MVLVAMVKRRGDTWAKRQAALVAKKVGRSSCGREEGIAGRRRRPGREVEVGRCVFLGELLVKITCHDDVASGSP